MACSFSDEKSPGEDGFTKEFYESFYDLIWRNLLNSYDAAFQNGSLSISLLAIFFLSISLLNIDYRIDKSFGKNRIPTNHLLLLFEFYNLKDYKPAYSRANLGGLYYFQLYLPCKK